MVIPIPARRASPTTTEGRPPLVGLKMQSDANTEMKSRVNCFSSLLNFNSNESTHVTSYSLIGKSSSIALYKKALSPFVDDVMNNFHFVYVCVAFLRFASDVNTPHNGLKF